MMYVNHHAHNAHGIVIIYYIRCTSTIMMGKSLSTRGHPNAVILSQGAHALQYMVYY